MEMDHGGLSVITIIERISSLLQEMSEHWKPEDMSGQRKQEDESEQWKHDIWESNFSCNSCKSESIQLIHYLLRQSFDNLKWVGNFIEIAKMSPAAPLKPMK